MTNKDLTPEQEQMLTPKAIRALFEEQHTNHRVIRILDRAGIPPTAISKVLNNLSRKYIDNVLKNPPKPDVLDGNLEDWQVFARRDDCLDLMVPSDLRMILGALKVAEGQCATLAEELRSTQEEMNRLMKP